MAAKAKVADNSAPATRAREGGKLAIEYLPIDVLVPYAANARSHPPEQIAKLVKSIREFGFIVPCLIDKNNVLVAGHGRVIGAKEAGHTEAPCIRAEHLTEAQVKAFRLLDNRVQLDSSWLDDLLRDELHILQGLDFDLSLTGFDEDELAKLFDTGAAGVGDGAGKNMLADKFMIPPFSVLNAREGWWQDRKKQWIALGIQSEVGRGGSAGGKLTMSATEQSLTPSAGQAAKNAKRGGGPDLGSESERSWSEPLSRAQRNGAVPGGGGKSAIYRKGPGFKYANR